jgi:methionine synthase II (cobalamin-independent)
MAWNCLPSCIGSLPHTDPIKAVDLVLEKLTHIPFWPQLPSRGFRENMYIQYAHYLPGARVDEGRKKVIVDLNNYDPEVFYTNVLEDNVDAFSYPPEYFTGFYELMSRPLPSTVRAIKGQITGPISLGFQITDTNDKPVIYNEAYAEIMRKNLNLMARWQERELRKKCSQTIMFVDEPYLSMIGTPFASVKHEDVVAWINEVLQGLEGKKGIHCCANTDWPLVMSTEIDLLSFDAYDYGYTISLYPEEVDRFLKRGGCLAWGMIPNSEEGLSKMSVPALVENAERLFRSLVDKGVDLDLILANSIITPQCGLSGLEENSAARVMDNLVAVSNELRAKHSLE